MRDEGRFPKDHLVGKNWSVWKSWGREGGSNFFKQSGLSVAPKPECGITQPGSRIAFDTVLTSSSSSPSTTISLVALVGLYKKVGKSSKQAINQDFDSMTTTAQAQRAAVVKTSQHFCWITLYHHNTTPGSFIHNTNVIIQQLGLNTVLIIQQQHDTGCKDWQIMYYHFVDFLFQLIFIININFITWLHHIKLYCLLKWES